MKIEIDEEKKWISIFLSVKEDGRWERARLGLSKKLGREASDQDMIQAILEEAIAWAEAQESKR